VEEINLYKSNEKLAIILFVALVIALFVSFVLFVSKASSNKSKPSDVPTPTGGLDFNFQGNNQQNQNIQSANTDVN